MSALQKLAQAAASRNYKDQWHSQGRFKPPTNLWDTVEGIRSHKRPRFPMYPMARPGARKTYKI